MPEHPSAFSDDQPWVSGQKDLLKRRPFADRVAGVITERAERSGFVIGIYGPWGDGKTSVLRMVEEALPGDVVVHWFNPWLFESPEQLVLMYFNELVAKLHISKGATSKELRRVLTKYGRVLSTAPAPQTLILGKGMLALSAVLPASPSLAAMRQEIESALMKPDAPRVVVMVDDIDRLDPRDVMAVLKLVKLTGHFPNTTFVLAFDDRVLADLVEKLLGQIGGGGRHFLEKIVQLPLRLPAADESVLLNAVLEEIGGALETVEADLTRAEVQEFRLYFDPLFQGAPRTLRVGKRVGNGLRFLLPLVQDEVRLVDLIMIEAL